MKFTESWQQTLHVLTKLNQANKKLQGYLKEFKNEINQKIVLCLPNC